MTHLSTEIQMANPDYPMGKILSEIHGALQKPKIQGSLIFLIGPQMKIIKIVFQSVALRLKLRRSQTGKHFSPRRNKFIQTIINCETFDLQNFLQNRQ